MSAVGCVHSNKCQARAPGWCYDCAILVGISCRSCDSDGTCDNPRACNLWAQQQDQINTDMYRKLAYQYHQARVVAIQVDPSLADRTAAIAVSDIHASDATKSDVKLDEILAGASDDVSLQAHEVLYYQRNPSVRGAGLLCTAVSSRACRQTVMKDLIEWTTGDRDAVSHNLTCGMLRFRFSLPIDNSAYRALLTLIQGALPSSGHLPLGLPPCLADTPPDGPLDKTTKDTLAAVLLGDFDPVIRVENRPKELSGKRWSQPAVPVPEKVDSAKEVQEQVIDPIERGEVVVVVKQ